jgi:hypothetical protein
MTEQQFWGLAVKEILPLVWIRKLLRIVQTVFWRAITRAVRTVFVLHLKGSGIIARAIVDIRTTQYLAAGSFIQRRSLAIQADQERRQAISKLITTRKRLLIQKDRARHIRFIQLI